MRILFTCRPSFGHFLPLLPLAQAARQRGHVVVFATNNPAILGQAQALGFGTASVGLSGGDSRTALDRTGVRIRRLPPAEIRPLAFGQWFSTIEAPPRLTDLDRLCAAFRPDVLVHEVAELAAPLAAASARLPWVTVGYGPLLQPAVADRAADGMGPLWQARGLSVPRWGGLYRHLYVDPCPPALQIPEIAELHARIGIRPTAGGRGEVADRSAIRRVYVTFGTLWNNGPASVDLLRLAVAGSAAAAAEVIVTVGRNNDPAWLGQPPDHVQIHRFIPQDELLPTCRCVVAHGGAGTLLGALAWGVPLLLLPQFADQFYNTSQAKAAGVAIALGPGGITRDAIATSVRSVLDQPAFASRAAHVRAELQAMPPVEAVLERIEAVAHHADAAAAR